MVLVANLSSDELFAVVVEGDLVGAHPLVGMDESTSPKIPHLLSDVQRIGADVAMADCRSTARSSGP
jgi:hypothetical protein